MLKTLAQVFLSQTREADFVARYGGKEFMGVSPERYLGKALGLADKIREKIAQSKFHYEAIAVSISTSPSFATFQHDDTISDVFKRADQALYKANRPVETAVYQGK
ncbi:MAG: diguanylate cyclase [Methylophagaceae bacterium]